MPRSARLASLAAALALVCAPWAPAARLTNPGNTILVDNDPHVAADFLKDDAAQARLKAEDEGYYVEVFTRAAELKDLSDLLHGIDGMQTYRDGLRNRTSCHFCQKPEEFLAWSRRYLSDLDGSKFSNLEMALFEWKSLSPSRLSWLKTKGATPQSWAKLDLDERQEFLKAWAVSRYDEMMMTLPKDPVSAKRYESEAWEISDILDTQRRNDLWERVERAKTAAEGLPQARRLAAKSGNAALKAELAKAAAGGDLDALLAGLNKVFDGAGKPNTQLRAQAPASKAQTFDPSSRRLVTELLKSGLQREMEGTWAGDELKAFYAAHPLDLTIGPSKNPNYIGWHLQGKITFNEKFITEYLKVKGRDIRDLKTDPGLLRELTAQITPLFVHEATHHRQYAWAKEHGIEHISGQHLELEAMQTEALFVLEKSMRDPTYLALLKKNAAHSMLARESLNKATDFKKSPAYFRDSIKAYNYPELLSLEGRSWSKAGSAWFTARVYASELARRQRLPPEQAARLEDGPPLTDDADTFDDWQAAIAKTGSKHLRALLAQENKELDAIPTAYSAFRTRLDASNHQLEAHRIELLAEKDPRKTRSAGKPVPSPANR